jgi:hypothetical protein
MSRSRFLRKAGVGAAGVAGAAMMGSGVVSAKAASPGDIAGMWISNISWTNDSAGPFQEGFVMKLGADNSVAFYTSQFNFRINKGKEIKTPKMGTWEKIPGTNKIRVMMFCHYNYAANRHLDVDLGVDDEKGEYERETRVFELINGDLHQIAEVLVGIFNDDEEDGDQLYTPVTDLTGDPSDYFRGDLGTAFAVDRHAIDRASEATDPKFKPFVFRKVPNNSGDLDALGATY